MSNAKTAEPLDMVARKIEEHSNKSDDHVIKAAMLVGEARRRVEAGEAGKVTWCEWGLKNIKLSPSRLYELQYIAKADDPRKALERIRLQTRERVKNHREKKAAETRALEEERRDLITWAKKAPIEEVRRVLGLTASNDNAAGSIEERPGLAGEQAA